MARSGRAGRVDVVVVGGSNFDYLVRGPRLPTPGSTVEGADFQDAPGGKGANQAIAAARLGARVAFISRGGRDEQGKRVVGRLRQEGVQLSALSRDRVARTGVALVLVDQSGEKQILTAPGANRNLTGREVSGHRQLIARAKVLLIQLEVPRAAVARAIGLADAAGVLTILDAAPPPPRHLPNGLLRRVHLLRCNADEATALTGISVTGRASARRAARSLLRRGVGAAIVGAKGGNLLCSADGDVWFPHLPVDVVDLTGAGDAFSAGLAVELSRGASLADATRFAAAAAAAKATVLGAQAGLPRRRRVLKLLKARHSALGTRRRSRDAAPSDRFRSAVRLALGGSSTPNVKATVRSTGRFQ